MGAIVKLVRQFCVGEFTDSFDSGSLVTTQMALCATISSISLECLPLLSSTVCLKLQRRMLVKFPKRSISNVYVCKQRVVPLYVCLFSLEDSALRSHEAFWEEPDDGSDSECDEEDEASQESDLDFESDWEEERDGSLAVVDEIDNSMVQDDIFLEIEALLNPEERAILLANILPNLEKISTAKWNPLHTLALSGQIRLLDNLLENGLDIDFADKDGLTSLHIAVIGKKEAVISHLLRKGANPHVKDKHGASPLHYAVQVGAMQTVKLLVKYKVDVNVADNEGWTPLHVAMQTRSRDMAKILLQNGADATRRNKDGNSPLDLSLSYGKDFKSYEMAKLLKLVPANRGL